MDKCNTRARVSESRDGNLLCRLREVDFIIVELTLYLDVYPDCAEARSYLAEMRKQRSALAAEYEERYGMLTIYGECGSSSSRSLAWPWEYSAN